MLAKLFRTSEGNIPFLQIIIGAILGAVGMFIYAKFFRPKILYEENIHSPIRPSVADGPGPEDTREGNTVKINNKSVPAPVMATSDSAPVLFDIGTLHDSRNRLPQLPSLKQLQDDDDEEEEDEDEDDDDEDEVEDHVLSSAPPF